MPGLNQTGPNGQGPMTGRKLGRCTRFGANLKSKTIAPQENNNEKHAEDIYDVKRLGFGRGRCRRGWGWQNR